MNIVDVFLPPFCLVCTPKSLVIFLMTDAELHINVIILLWSLIFLSCELCPDYSSVKYG